SSRRRHTRSLRDWSSDVCSSDLWPLIAAMAAAVVIVAVLRVILHQFVIRPVLTAEPINQLLVTGGVLFFLQAAATLVFGIEFRRSEERRVGKEWRGRGWRCW